MVASLFFAAQFCPERLFHPYFWHRASQHADFAS